MRYIKKILIVIITMVMAVSCINVKATLDFKTPTTGSGTIDVKISKDFVTRDEIEDRLDNIITLLKEDKIMATYTYRDNGDNYNNYVINFDFNDAKEIERVINKLDEGIVINVDKISNNVYSIEILNPDSDPIQYEITVNGQIQTINDETASLKTNKVEFETPSKRYSLTYEYKKKNSFIIFLIILLILSVIAFVIYSLLKVKGKIAEKPNDKKEEEDIIITE